MIAVLLCCPIAMMAAEKVDFSREVLPILSANCFRCHGPDEKAREADLRLDRREGAIAKRDEMPAIVPGKPDQSGMIKRISSDDDDVRMPPPKAGAKLSAKDIDMLRKWVESGGEYSEHWAFAPPQRAEAPTVEDASWCKTPIDYFILVRLEDQSLKPADQASREVLIRRATLDLTGLPPTPQEVEKFVADKSDDAFEYLIDRLLDSPHYGERWGRHWLDVARYADSGGFETDIFFGHAWRFRDYVIRALNDDKPFDRFIREQVAGDELFPGDKDALIATGFFTTGPVLQESGMVPGKLEYDQLTDAADTTGSAFLGLTMGCARCHDHKYDPISQRDYFCLQAFFADSDEVDLKRDGSVMRDRAAIKNTLQEFTIEQAKDWARRETDEVKRNEYLRKLGDLYIAKDSSLNKKVSRSRSNSEIETAIQKYKDALAKSEAAEAGAADDSAKKDLEELLHEVGKHVLDAEPRGSSTRQDFRDLGSDDERRQFLIDLGKQNVDRKMPTDGEDAAAQRIAIGQQHLDDGSEIPLRVLGHRTTPVAVHILKRGELEQPGDVVEAEFPTNLAGGVVAGEMPPEERRAALANWLASPRNPLTARVIVNRIWQWHFGQGLVRTPDDFGLHGERPTHPALLDWLAVEFMEHGWSIKYINRLIMRSAVYQESSSVNADALARDPDNRWLSRFQPRRMEAEFVLDSIRSVAGTLDTTMYGLPIAPPLDEQEQIGNFRKWPTSRPEDSNRRAIYVLVRRSFRFPTLSAFDLPDNISSCARRDITTVPNQALTLLNNRTMKEQAEAFAARLIAESDEKKSALADLAWRYVYGRTISDQEREQAEQFIQKRYEGAGEAAAAKKVAVAELCLALFNTNEFIYLP
jgi:Protein of unknown function (DUF1553)/Protein of unknown function (DUF1549)/Planctomycete cytochrome C